MRRRQFLGNVAAGSGLGAAFASDTAVAAETAQSDLTIEDPTGDDDGPGTYMYPPNEEFPEGCYDVSEVVITDSTTHWEWTVHMNGPVTDPWGGDDGFSVQAFQVYFHDPNAPSDTPQSATGRDGLTSDFQGGYHYRVVVHGGGGPKAVESADDEILVDGIGTSVSREENTIGFRVPKSPFQTDDIEQMKMAFLLLSNDTFGTGDVRQAFAPEAGDWTFGGAKEDTTETAPRVIDLVGPETVLDQQEILSAYDAGSVATIPLYPVEALVTGEPSEEVRAVASPGPTLFAGTEGQLDASDSSDPSGQELRFQWEQTMGPEATLSNATSAQPTFVAPRVDSETRVEFRVTVTNEDGDSGTSTTAAVVRPQSENPAPVASVAVGDRAVDPGSVVLLDGASSEDPNGGDLVFQWEQTGGEPTVELSMADSFSAAFTAPQVDEDTTMEFTLTVSDSQGKVDTETVSITVRGTGTETTTVPETPDTTTKSWEETTIERSDENDTTKTPVDTSTPGETRTPVDTKTPPTTDDTALPGESEDETTGSGSGPGFGGALGILGVAGGAVYATKRRLADE